MNNPVKAALIKEALAPLTGEGLINSEHGMLSKDEADRVLELVANDSVVQEAFEILIESVQDYADQVSFSMNG
jgi:hypothetical protein